MVEDFSQNYSDPGYGPNVTGDPGPGFETELGLDSLINVSLLKLKFQNIIIRTGNHDQTSAYYTVI